MQKIITLLQITLALTPYVFADPEHPKVTEMIQPDPRVEPYSPWSGKTPKGEMKSGYVVIVWANHGLQGYQIWGDHRMVNQQTLETALEKLLEKKPKDVYYVANNWAAGSELEPMLKKYSERFKIECSGYSTFGFKSVDFREETKDTTANITKSIDEATPVLDRDSIERDSTRTEPEPMSKGGN